MDLEVILVCAHEFAEGIPLTMILKGRGPGNRRRR